MNLLFSIIETYSSMETPSSGTATPVDLEQGDGQIRKRLTVTFRDLNVRVTAPDAALGDTLWSEMDPRQLGGLLNRSNSPKRVRFNQTPLYRVLTFFFLDNSKRCRRPGKARGNGMLN